MLSSSQNTDSAVFNDILKPSSNPPSSPLCFPWEQQTDHEHADAVPSELPQTAFSVLGKRKALDAFNNHARRAKEKIAVSSRTNKATTQLQISLGQQVQKKCQICEMEYVSSSTEDRMLHHRYHKQNTEGYFVGKDFIKRTDPQRLVSSGGDHIVFVDRSDKAPRRRCVQAVLEIVQRDLGAVRISEDDLWSSICDETAQVSAKYEGLIYVKRAKCVGFLLVQKIKEAFRVVQPILPEAHHPSTTCKARSAVATLKARQRMIAREQDQPLRLSATPTSARLGVSRIWVSSSHRRQHIAETLLDAAYTRFLSVALSAKHVKEQRLKSRSGNHAAMSDEALVTLKDDERIDDVAFSQPTALGTKLARSWYGQRYGWLVYVD